jgi:hypothetical protein
MTQFLKFFFGNPWYKLTGFKTLALIFLYFTFLSSVQPIIAHPSTFQLPNYSSLSLSVSLCLCLTHTHTHTHTHTRSGMHKSSDIIVEFQKRRVSKTCFNLPCFHANQKFVFYSTLKSCQHLPCDTSIIGRFLLVHVANFIQLYIFLILF